MEPRAGEPGPVSDLAKPESQSNPSRVNSLDSQRLSNPFKECTDVSQTQPNVGACSQQILQSSRRPTHAHVGEHESLEGLLGNNFSHMDCPVVVEIFCGSARVTAALKTEGIHAAFGVDHNISKASSTAKKLDLTSIEGQRLLLRWLDSPCVVGIFIAPPCGTCSLARLVQLRDAKGRKIPCPKPLRSWSKPSGLPHLAARD